MNRLNLAAVKPTIARVAGMCQTDDRVVDLINEAQERLMNRGKWTGLVTRYRVCVNDGCLVWPRQLVAIEAYSICDSPGTIRNEFYEFLGNGPGLLSDDSTCAGNTLVDRGTTCSFDTIAAGAVDRKIRVYADVDEDGDAQILLQGYDENGNWIRTQVSGEWVDGEYVDINKDTPQLSTHKFTFLTSVVKPVTNGNVRLYEYDTTNSVNIKSLAVYEPDEERPLYRKSFIPNLSEMGSCEGTTDCDNKTITVMAKLRHIPVVNDLDWLMIGSLGALKLAVQAILKEEKDLIQEAAAYWLLAERELQAELSNYQGDGQVVPIRFENSAIWGGGGFAAIM